MASPPRGDENASSEKSRFKKNITVSTPKQTISGPKSPLNPNAPTFTMGASSYVVPPATIITTNQDAMKAMQAARDTLPDDVIKVYSSPIPDLQFPYEIQAPRDNIPDDGTKVYTAHIPHFHPPYEDPIDGRFCLHFDHSAKIKHYDLISRKGEELFSPTFDLNQDHLLSQYNPPLQPDISIKTCVTSAGRAMTSEGTGPGESPPFFCIVIDATRIHKLGELYAGYKKLLENEFPKDKYPELYPSNGQMVIRFFWGVADKDLA